MVNRFSLFFTYWGNKFGPLTALTVLIYGDNAVKVLTLSCFLLFVFSFGSFSNAAEVVGWLEKVVVQADGVSLLMKAKMDSGAKTASIHANAYQLFEKDGQKWVRFKVANFEGKAIDFERPVVRTAKIKRHFGEYQERPVVMLGLCLDNIYVETEVNLVDREGLNYKLLVGRKYLAGNFLIDSGNTFIVEPRCEVKTPKRKGAPK